MNNSPLPTGEPPANTTMKPIMSVLVTVYDNGKCNIHTQALEGFDCDDGSRTIFGAPITHLDKLPEEIRNAMEAAGLIHTDNPEILKERAYREASYKDMVTPTWYDLAQQAAADGTIVNLPEEESDQ